MNAQKVYISTNFLSSAHRLTNWKPSHTHGQMTFVGNSFLVAGVPGFYFIYSQIYYYDGSTNFMGHSTYINEKVVMQSVSSVVNETKKYNTNFHGGVFRLNKGDRISVRVPFTKAIFMKEDKSFFGAFLVHPVTNSTLNSGDGY